MPNRPRRSRWLLATLLAAFSVPAFAHEGHSLVSELAQRWRWAEFTSWSGLPSDDVLHVVEERDGTPWVATDRGLAWYDGHRWWPVDVAGRTSLAADALVALPSGGIGFVMDSQAWVGGRDGFERPLVPTGRVQGLAGLRDGSLLVIVEGALHRVRPGEHGEPAERLFPDEPPPWAATLWSRGSGRVLVGTSTGLLLTDGESWREILHLGNPKEAFTAIGLAFETGEDEGLFTVMQPFDLQGAWRWRLGRPVERIGPAGPEGVLHAATRSDGMVVLAYESGAMGLRDELEGDWRSVAVPPAIGGVTSLLFRGNGDLWAGTTRGLWLFRASSDLWHVEARAEEGDRNVVHAILRTRDGSTWLGTRAGVEIHRPDGEVEVVRSIDGSPIPVVTALAQDGEGAVWVGSGSGFEGVWRFDGTAWRHLGEAEGLNAPRVHAVRIDRSGRPWFLGLSRHRLLGGPGAHVFEGGRFEHVSLPGGAESQRVYDFVEAADGTAWFASSGGLHRLREAEWRSFTSADGLVHDRVFTVELDEAGRPWFSSGRGGACTILEDDRLHCESSLDGLPNDAVWDLAFDEQGALWASTRGGLGVRRQGAWSTLLPHQGLPLLRLWPLLSEGSKLWIGTHGLGLVRLDLSEARHPAPRIEFLPPDSEGGLTRLAWRADSWWGEQAEQDAETRWRLKGEEWSRWDRRRELVLQDLDPGRHVLEVESKGLLGQRAPAPARLSFDVPLPFWDRPQVLLPLALLLLAGLAWLASSVRRRGRFARVLSEREERFRSILDNARDVVFTAGLDGRLTMLNRAGRELSGLGDGDPSTLDWYRLLPPGVRERAADALRRKIAGETATTYEIELEAADGQTTILEVQSRLVSVPGRPPEIHGVARDVSERRRLEAQLRHAQKLESLGLLAGGVAHDFNNLLHSILGNLDLARAAWREGRSPRRALENLETAAERATDLARVMLAYSGKARFEIGPLDLSELSEEILRLLRASLPRSVRFEVELAEDLPALEGDRAQVQQVVLNLVTNAADALGEDGGLIRVRTGSGEASSARRGEAVLDSALGDSRVVWLEVADEGPGIDAEARQRIFDPFYSTKGAGRGLGLSAVLGIVRVHGGSLFLDSTPKSGSRFRLLFRALDAPAPKREPPASSGARGLSELSGARILVADDEDRVRDVACLILERLGCTTIEARDGLEVQQIVREEGASIDAVLLDLVMPRCNGRQAFAALREMAPDLPVVLTSGYSEEEETARAAGSGAAGFLMKPYRVADLERALSAAIRSRQRSGH